MLSVFAEFVSKQAGSYWNRSACAALTSAAAFVAVERDRLPEKLEKTVTRAVLRAYGLSREFW